MQNNNTANPSYVGLENLIALFKGDKNSETNVKLLLYMAGIVLTPVTLAGALFFGYKRAYEKIFVHLGTKPVLRKLHPFMWAAMLVGALVAWGALIVLVFLMTNALDKLLGGGTEMPLIIGCMSVNLILCYGIFRIFKKWQNKVLKFLQAGERFGTARWATKEELSDLEGKNGLYVGGGVYGYPKHGHAVLFGGARSGKLVNLIAPFLLGQSNYEGSIFCIDVKGEISAVTGRFRRRQGRVITLDPWGINPMVSDCYNPLDLVSGRETDDFLSDDIAVIAELIIPKDLNSDDYWNSRARSLISVTLMHIILSLPKEQHTLSTLWKNLRTNEEEFLEMLGDMAVSDNEIVAAGGNEFLMLAKSGEKTFASIMSSALDKTDFLKSPLLRRSLQSSTFDVNTLSDGKTSLFVILPPDQLEVQGQWLRLVFVTALRAVIRARTNKSITFLLDECAAMGYLPMLKTAFATYAGYNVSMYPIFQDLSQVRNIYGEGWETFISNAAIRQFTGVNDAFTSEYLEKLCGIQTIVSENGKEGEENPNATARPLATADELRRGSKDFIFTFIEQRPPTYLKKLPYWDIPELYDRYDDNPYYITAK